MSAPVVARSDLRTSAWIFVSVILLTAPLLGSLEFFRHTEADRALISWEMWESGDWIVPHLLGDRYLTKPPLFYQLTALAYELAGGVSEAAARSVSLVTGALIVALTFLFARFSGLPREDALIASIVLAFAGHFASQLSLAEMDMAYTCFCGMALYAGYASVSEKPTLRGAALGAALAGVAFLAKGPPVLVFYGCGIGAFVLLEAIRLPSAERVPYVLRNLWCHLLASVVFLGVVALWLVPILERVPVDSLVEEFRGEVVERFVRDRKADHRMRGFFFYFFNIPVSFLPGTLLFVPFAAAWKRRALRPLSPELARLCRFSAAVVVPSIVIFSLSSGKSGRYLMPLYPCLAFLALGAWRASGSPRPRWVGPEKKTLAIILCIVVAVRLVQFSIVVPYRNRQQSVRPATEKIHAAIGAGREVLTLELFDRWALFYLKQAGHPSRRLTPRMSEELRNDGGGAREYVLLETDLEAWRLDQLTEAGGAYELISKAESKKDSFLLISVPRRDLWRFLPSKRFPTDPSEPYPGGKDSPPG